MPRRVRRVPGRPQWVRVLHRGGQLWANVGTSGIGLNPVRTYHLTMASYWRLLNLAQQIQHNPRSKQIAYTSLKDHFTIFWRL